MVKVVKPVETNQNKMKKSGLHTTQMNGRTVPLVVSHDLRLEHRLNSGKSRMFSPSAWLGMSGLAAVRRWRALRLHV